MKLLRNLLLFLCFSLNCIPLVYADPENCLTGDSTQMAIKGKVLFEDDFKYPVDYTKGKITPIQEGWSFKVWHAIWKPTPEGIQSNWEAGHNPVIGYDCDVQNVVVEIDFRFQKDTVPARNGYLRVNFTNKELDPRAYCVAGWANANSTARIQGVILEHEEWRSQGYIGVAEKIAKFQPDTWYTMRVEVLGDSVQVTCNGVSVAGRYEKFGLRKKQLVIGVGKCNHELRKLRVYEALPNSLWKMPNSKVAVPIDSIPGRRNLSQATLEKIRQMTPIFDGKTLNGWIQSPLAPTNLAREDIIDPAAFAKRLQTKSDPVSSFLYDKLDSAAHIAIREAIAGNTNTRQTVSPLIRSINTILKGQGLYSKARFKGTVLRPKTEQLLKKKPKGYDLDRLNRLLLEDVYTNELAKSPDSAWIVKDGAMISTGAGRGVIYTEKNYESFRLIFQVRQTSGNHFPGVLLFCERPVEGSPGLDALGGIQFAVPSGGHWDYRPGINNSGKHFRRPIRVSYNLKEWSQAEILVDGKKGIARMAIAQPVGTKPIEVLRFDDINAAKAGPIALQMHNALLFDEYRDIRIEINPKEADKLITLE